MEDKTLILGAVVIGGGLYLLSRHPPVVALMPPPANRNTPIPPGATSAALQHETNPVAQDIAAAGGAFAALSGLVKQIPFPSNSGGQSPGDPYQPAPAPAAYMDAAQSDQGFMQVDFQNIDVPLESTSGGGPN